MTTIPLFRLRSAFAVKTVATMPTPFLRWNSHHYYYLFNPIKSHWYLNTDHPFFVISKQVSETYYQWGEFCRTWKSSQIPTTTVAAGSLTFTFFTFTDSLSQIHFHLFTFTFILSPFHFHRFQQQQLLLDLLRVTLPAHSSLLFSHSASKSEQPFSSSCEKFYFHSWKRFPLL